MRAVEWSGDGVRGLDDRNQFLCEFEGRVSVVPGEARLDDPMRTLPAVGVLRHSNSAFGLVAGARYEPVQIKLTPLNRYLAGLRWAA